jgi:ketosteroid isomerase-like protein
LQPDAAVKFGGDPRVLPFADDKIRTGRKAVIGTFKDQLRDSAPRVFDIEEIYIKGDRFIANTFEARTAVESGRNYEIPVNILFTASRKNGGRVSSIEGIFDSTITTTAFTGKYPFPTAPV